MSGRFLLLISEGQESILLVGEVIQRPLYGMLPYNTPVWQIRWSRSRSSSTVAACDADLEGKNYR